MAGEELAGWLWEGMRLWQCPQNHYEMFSYQNDASRAGDFPGISLQKNFCLLFLLIDNWCDEITLVPFPGTRLFVPWGENICVRQRDNKESEVTQADEVWLCEGADLFCENLVSKDDLMWRTKDENADASP